jgi:hypothetical protein
VAIDELAFDPVDGWENTTSFPTTPASETAVRELFQELHNQTRDYLNALAAVLNSTTDGASGADNIAMTAITETGAAATVQAIVEALVTRIKAVTDGAAGADLVGMTAIADTGAAATVQAVIEALITKIKATTDSASGADLVGATQITAESGTTVQGILEWLYAQLTGIVLGQIPDGSLTATKLATDAVETVKIKDGAVTADKVAADVATQAELDAHAADNSAHGDAASLYRSGKDSNGIYVTVQWKRSDTTLFKQSVLSGGTSPAYTTRTVTYYAANGTTVVKTVTYALSYTSGELTSEVISA